ncbi:MAG: nitrilase-related carbon-nitrogen hydrolase [Planctomycetota bacterium]
MRLHALQTSPAWLDVDANRRSIEAALGGIAPSRGDLVVLPEMCETGWTTELEVHRATRGSAEFFGSLASRFGVWLQAGVATVEPDGRVANAVLVVAPDGGVRATYRKFFLFPSEREAFVPGRELHVVDMGGVRVCPLICYDLRFPELWRLAALAGAEIFSISSCWPAPRHAHWRALLVARAIENQAVIVAANRSGSDPSNAYDGGSAIVGHLGERLAESGAECGAIGAEFDRAGLDSWRSRFGALRDARRELLGTVDLRLG